MSEQYLAVKYSRLILHRHGAGDTKGGEGALLVAKLIYIGCCKYDVEYEAVDFRTRGLSSPLCVVGMFISINEVLLPRMLKAD